MGKKTLFLTLIIIGLLSFLCSAQDSQHIGVGTSIKKVERIVQHDIRDVFKDSRGFIWLATLDGLFRFDGYTSKGYRVNQSSNSISSNMINRIAEDNLGNIWVTTFGKGLCKFNPVTEEFTSYRMENVPPYQLTTNDVSSFLIDGNSIWIGNWQSLIKLEMDDAMSKVVSQSSIGLDRIDSSLNKVVVRTIFKDKDSKIWLGLNTSLVRINNSPDDLEQIEYSKKMGNVEALHYCDSILVAVGEFVSRVSYDEQGEIQLQTIAYMPGNSLQYQKDILWIGNRLGVYAFKLEDSDFELVNHYQSGSENGLPNRPVTSLVVDNNQVWVGTAGGGVFLMGQNDSYFEHYRKTPLENSLFDDHIRAIFEDSQQNLWIGTEQGGLNYLVGDNKYQYAQGVGQVSMKNYPRENNRVYAIDEQFTLRSSIRKRLIWLGTSHPTFLISLDPKTMELQPQSEHAKALSFVFDIEVQNDSTLWVGTYGEGLWRFKTDVNGTITGSEKFIPEIDNPHAISSDIIRSILYDGQGNLWIGTDKGLNFVAGDELNRSQPVFNVFREGKLPSALNNEYILKLFQAGDGKIWMGSMGGGLIGIEEFIRKDSILFKTISVKDGLPNNSIKAIEEDGNGNLWLSSNQGISRYNPVTRDIVNYDEADGLQGNEFEELASCGRQNGQLIFGGINGVNVFYPEQIRKDSIKPRLYFSSLSILNEVVRPGVQYQGNLVLNHSLEHTKSIELMHEQNSFSIGFDGLHFNSPQKVKYKYKLEGFDETWIRSNVNYRIAKYTNIPSGEYMLKVSASNSDNVWTDEPIQLEIKIKPHPLLSTTAYIVYLMLFILVMYLLYKINRYLVRGKNEVLIAEIEKKNSEEVTQSKLRFFTNISHEFRTPLTLISIPLEKLIKDKSLSAIDKNKNLNIIKQNSNLMLRLVNQILDFRKLEQDKMQLSLQSLNIVKFARDILQTFEPLAEQKEVELGLICSHKTIFLPFDPDCVEKIIYNLLSNALKFTAKNGKVILELMPLGENLLLQVSDTGIGIKESDKPFIFQRYFHRTGESKIINSGTGIGLSLIKGLVELHQGEIEVESKEGKGSIFKVYLPKISDLQISKNDQKEDFLNKVIDPVIDEEKQPSNPLVEANKYTILIVEDNQALRTVIAGIFESKFIVLQAEDGLVGYDLCLEKNPDIILSDIMMPNMDGIQLLSKIKNDQKTSHIPIVLLTAKGTVENQIDGFIAGADAYISKPFDSQLLYRNVLSIIQNREKLRNTFVKEIEINPMLVSNSPVDADFIEKILSLIEENLSDAEFNVDRLADAYGFSRNHLNRKIKALTGETAINFLRDIRLKHAGELLRQGQYNVSEVTWRVGYNDLNVFRKRFKERFGCRPSEYANQKEPSADSSNS